ncbi:MAG: UvrB/UvrC motif-containing protein, partial [Deltaproteobacteria bacterium]|nr:UvrB/UvrC motif-containing protein [Deltaproteobacteria bacterium]
VEDLLKEIKLRAARNERVLVTTLTKKLAEELTKYYHAQGIKVKYLHSDIVTLERIEILRDLRLGAFDVLIGINLLREGLDLPEVSLVAVLDADKEGFLRSERSLIQTIGRAARNVEGFVILYAEKITESMKKAMFETERRRFLQEKYNKKHGIIPTTIVKKIRDSISASYVSESKKSASIVMQLDLVDEGVQLDRVKELTGEYFTTIDKLPEAIEVMEKDMKEKAKLLQFEDAALLRDRVKKLKSLAMFLK